MHQHTEVSIHSDESEAFCRIVLEGDGAFECFHEAVSQVEKLSPWRRVNELELLAITEELKKPQPLIRTTDVPRSAWGTISATPAAEPTVSPYEKWLRKENERLANEKWLRKENERLANALTARINELYETNQKVLDLENELSSVLSEAAGLYQLLTEIGDCLIAAYKTGTYTTIHNLTSRRAEFSKFLERT